MKLLIRLCLVSLFAVITFGFTGSYAAAGANFAGTWSVSGTLGDPVIGTISPVCTLKQEGAEVHGTCKGPNGFGTAQGAVDGAKILLTWKHAATTANGVDGIATLKGTLGSDGFIRGTWTDSAGPAGAWGKFTAQKVK